MDKGGYCRPFRIIRGSWWLCYVIGFISTKKRSMEPDIGFHGSFF